MVNKIEPEHLKPHTTQEKRKIIDILIIKDYTVITVFSTSRTLS